MAHLNIRSLWNKFDTVKQMVITSGIDMISFSETWLNDAMSSNILDIPGYTCYRHDRSWKENNVVKKGGGLCSYVKDATQVSHMEFIEFNMSTIDIELFWISLILPNCKKIIIGNVYRPPQGNTKSFCDSIDSKLTAIRNSQNGNNEIFILGDFNINYRTPSNPDTKLLKWFEQRSSLKQIINDITRFSNLNSCIDLIFTDSLYLFEHGTLDVNLSDHEMIFVTRKHVSKPKMASKFTGRSYINFNEDLFLETLGEKDWEPLYHAVNPNVAWSIMKNNIQATIDTMCPIRSFNIKQMKDPWISNEILEAIHDKDRLLSKAKRTNNQYDWIVARRRRNEVKNMTKHAKSNFIKDNLNEYQNDSKKFWKSLSDILPSKSTKNLQKIFLKDSSNNQIIDDKIAANMMNDFFTSIGPNLAKNMTEPWVYTGDECPNNIQDIRTNSPEVMKYLQEIDTTKASAVPNLASKILKPAFIKLVDQLTFIFNLCFAANTFPGDWKIATIVPLPKEGDLSQCTNYRPISLLPMPGKILEHIIHNRISTFCEENTILNENQGGFRKNHSTISTVASFTDNLYEALNNKEISIATFIDFSKAFDTVNHKILLQKMSKIGVKGNTKFLLQNYLENRTQTTCINGVDSDPAIISCGVPQGSVLGPLLFLIYINDLCNVIQNCSSYLYADDTVIVANAPNILEARIQSQNDLDNLASWCKCNKLSINIKKTKSMVVGTRSMVKKHTAVPRLKISGTPLEYVFQYKYLGVTIDEILSFNAHLNNTIKLVAHKIFLLHKIKYYITENAAIKIYKSMIIPYIDYGDIFYLKSNAIQVKKLQTLQNRALRICYDRPNVPTNMLHQSAQIPKLIPRREAHLLNFMFKSKNNPKRLNNRNVHTRLHDAPVFITSKPNNEKFKANVFYNGAISWNGLPVHIRNIETYTVFKNTQKKWALSQL